MAEHNIPTARYAVHNNYDDALQALHDIADTGSESVVVKASGLAAGKGVFVCNTFTDAKEALQKIMKEQVFGESGQKVVIEECLIGREISVLAFSDGQTIVPMRVSRDYKRAYDNNKGPNTGGMGAYAPTTDISQKEIDTICETVLRPTIEGMAAKGTPYVGVLYAGLMIDQDKTKVLEFNCRFGDPETQVVLPLLETDLYEILLACVEGQLASLDIQWKAETCATVVLASPGYPAQYPKGLPISGLDTVPENVIVFHAGTAIQNEQIVTAGGRVLNVTTLGQNLPNALERIYATIEGINFDNMHFRRDIGKIYE